MRVKKVLFDKMDMMVDITRGCQSIYMHYVYTSKEGGQGHVENSSVGREAVMEGQER